MKLTKAELKALYLWQPTRNELNRSDCLSEELLSRLGASDVSEADRLQIADHLITCPDCAQEYKLVRATKTWAETMANGNGAAASVSLTEAQPTTTEDAAQAEAETTPKWWQALIPRLFSRAGFNPFTAALTGLFLITSLSLATWLVALHFKHKTELARLADEQAQAPRFVASDEPVTPETLQARLDEAQKQLSDVQTQLTEQNADRVLSNQELLGIQNSTLQKEMDELALPHLDAPVVELDASKLPAATDPAKEAAIPVEVPPTAALFTVIWRKPADKTYPNYLVEWLDPKRTKPLWSGVKKAAPELTKIALTVVRRNYPSGKYRLRLSGVDGKKKDVLETFNLDVKFISPPKAARRRR